MRYGLGLVAAIAIDKLQILACGVPAPLRVQIAVAVHACRVGVNGCRVSVFGDEDRYILTCKGARELGVGVTLEAILIVLRQRRGCCEPEDRSRQSKPTLSMTNPGACTHRHFPKLYGESRVRNILIVS